MCLVVQFGMHGILSAGAVLAGGEIIPLDQVIKEESGKEMTIGELVSAHVRRARKMVLLMPVVLRRR